MEVTPATPEVVIEDPRIERGRMMYEDLAYEDGPQFRIGEVTKFFFGRTDHWLRWLQKVIPSKDKPNYLILNGREVGTRKTAMPCAVCKTPHGKCIEIAQEAVSRAVEIRALLEKAEAEGDVEAREALDAEANALHPACCGECGGPDTHDFENGPRVFGLRDVEEIAYALAQQGRIDGVQLRNALVALDTVGRIWGVRDAA